MIELTQNWIDELDFLNNDKKIIDILDRKISLFKANFELNGDLDLFFELVYCLLTAQTKFVSAAKVVEELKYDEKFDTRFYKSSDSDFFNYLMPILRKNVIRFHNNKANNIVYARKSFLKNDQLILRDKLIELDGNFERRKWLIDNVLGFSYKESSHFLRNIGFGNNLAILDRHVLRTMHWLGVSHEIPETITSKVYLEYEKKLTDFSSFVGIPMERLDFLLFILSKRHIEKSEIDVFSLLEELK